MGLTSVLLFSLYLFNLIYAIEDRQDGLGSPVDLVDSFLLAIDISPSAVELDVKRVGGVHLACAILHVANPDTLVTRRDGTIYVNESQAHQSETAWEYPRCIWTPDDVDGIILAVKTAVFTNSQFAVRSGGHSPFEGFANINGGLLVSLSGIADLSYDATTQTQRSGFGNRWEDVYGYLSQYDRLVVGGRTGTVGLALTLGGGLSHSSNEHGWAAQNVISYEMVLANGSLVTASATENDDLYFALKAGQNNFGIVTHITQATYPIGKVWGGVVIYPGNASDMFMQALADYQAEGQLDVKSAMLPYIILNTDVIIQQFAYLDAVEKPSAFKDFYSLPTIEDQTQLWDSFADLVNAPTGYSLPRYYYAATTMYLDKETYVGVTEIVKNKSVEMGNITGGDLLILPQPISLTMLNSSAMHGTSPFQLRHRPQLWFALTVGWSLKKDDNTVEKILLDTLDSIENYTKSREQYDPFQFVNDAYDTQTPLENYGEETYARLQAARTKYDPTGVFRDLVIGGFKVDKVV
ncbi:bifunctional solanapyrone synthase [Xylariaceae sp. FL0255]|nr:bifunctional solanapyrone synthase [Xylariaceae sp. FL0255]